jgi:hypothetical protein
MKTNATMGEWWFMVPRLRVETRGMQRGNERTHVPCLSLEQRNIDYRKRLEYEKSHRRRPCLPCSAIDDGLASFSDGLRNAQVVQRPARAAPRRSSVTRAARRDSLDCLSVTEKHRLTPFLFWGYVSPHQGD